jgi:septum formation protein
MGLEFEIIPSDYEEDMTMIDDPAELAKALARGKAEDVAARVENGLVIGIDTFIAYEGRKIGKPKDEQDAARILRMISGSTVDVYSGLAVIDAANGSSHTDFERTQVRMHNMTDADIRNYIRTGEPMDKAGAFAIQGLGAVFVKDINGCYSNITGTPIYKLSQALQKFGVDISQHRGWHQKSDL